MRYWQSVSIGILFLLILLVPAVSHGLTVTNLNNAGAGSLRDAVANTPAGGTVDFAVTGTIVLSSEIVIDKSLTIQGPGANLLTVSGGNSTRVFNVMGTDVKINDIRIANGFVDDGNGTWGAAILLFVPSISLELNDCVVDNNTSAGSLGLGVISFLEIDISLVVNRCSFTNNSTTPPGGGLVVGGVFGSGASNTFLEVNDSTFTNNLAQASAGQVLGGVVGLASSGLDYSFNNCTFDSNRAIVGEGQVSGGVLGDGAADNNIEFTNCTFYGNTAECNGDDCKVFGGAIGYGASLASSEISCNFCTFESNSVSCTGTNCTVSGDTISSEFTNNPNMEISNSIIDSDDPSDSCAGQVVSLGYNIDNGNTCLTGGSPGDKPNTDPVLDPAGLQDNGGPTETIAILATSPAVDMAKPACPPPDTDQRGILRPQGLACDIGAYELIVSVVRPIPTLSEWGLIAMAGVLGIIGMLALRRRKVTA